MFDDLHITPLDRRGPTGPCNGDGAPIVIPPGPCENCPWYEACAVQSLACRVFLHFVSKGAIVDGKRRPNRGTYRRLFGPPAGHTSESGGLGSSLDWIDELLAS
ncbi:MAG: hypothetical protein FIA96_16215 [Betaproteobacteria bacterium]|nr:hypothetical protein [Betaproteobacteria bacterium]